MSLSNASENQALKMFLQGVDPATITVAVWTAMAADYLSAGSMGAKLNSAASGGVDYSALAAAILAAAAATPIAANIKKINDTTVIGTGSASDTWGPA